MSGEVLYRKYRPDSFEKVLGQETIVKALSGALESGRISHAYLFSGSRGTGKTSIARIFAGTLGCSPNDIFEIDAASNRGIDEIRELREAVRTRPFDSPYKTYIIDEAHMLTKEAANAFLKTLEEPPEHTIFILATTEIEKLPDTIVSRCEVHMFQKPSREILKQMIFNVAQSEGMELEPQSGELIALLGDGSFRDTHGVLQKVLSLSPASASKKISHDDIESLLGAPKSELVNQFIDSVARGDIERGLSAIKKTSAHNTDMRVYLDLIVRKLRQALLLRCVPEMKQEIQTELSEEDFDFLQGLASDKSVVLSSDTLKELLDAYQSIKRFNIPELALELALIHIVGEEKQGVAGKSQ